MRLSSARGTKAPLVEGAHEIRAAITHERNEPEDDAGEDRDRPGEEEHGRMKPALVEPGNGFRAHREERLQSGESDAEPYGTRERREDEALGEEVTQQIPPLRAERDPEPELALPTFCAHEKEVRDVGAGDEENETHGSQEDPEEHYDQGVESSPPRRALTKRWAELIYRIYEVDPLTCRRCGAQMKILAFITEPGPIRRILDHLDQKARPRPPPEPSELNVR